MQVQDLIEVLKQLDPKAEFDDLQVVKCSANHYSFKELQSARSEAKRIDSDASELRDLQDRMRRLRVRIGRIHEEASEEEVEGIREIIYADEC